MPTSWEGKADVADAILAQKARVIIVKGGRFERELGKSGSLRKGKVLAKMEWGV